MSLQSSALLARLRKRNTAPGEFIRENANCIQAMANQALPWVVQRKHRHGALRLLTCGEDRHNARELAIALNAGAQGTQEDRGEKVRQAALRA